MIQKINMTAQEFKNTFHECIPEVANIKDSDKVRVTLINAIPVNVFVNDKRVWSIINIHNHETH